MKSALAPSVDVVCIASWNVDLVARIPQPLARGQTLLSKEFARSPGGKGSNAAVAAARQGARVGLIARIGRDDFGRMGLALWTQEGITTDGVVQADGEMSGTALILVYDDGDNSIAVYPGAGAGLQAPHVEAARTLIASARWIMASCEVPQAACLHGFQLARQLGVRTLLNPAPATPLSDALWPLIDVLTPNEGELLQLAGSGHDVDTAATAVLARGVGAVVVTLGEKGCKLYRPGVSPLAVPGQAVKVVDTIGAGDTFTGALVAALARGEPWEHALPWANAAAALSTQAAGAIGGMPNASQVRDLLAA